MFFAARRQQNDYKKLFIKNGNGSTRDIGDLHDPLIRVRAPL